MITDIREKWLKSPVFKVVLWALLIIILIFWTMPGVLNRFVGGSTWVVDVNGHTIGYGEFVLKTLDQERQIQLFRQQHGQYADALLQARGMNIDPKILALETLVREELMTQSARKIGTAISD